MPAGSFLGALLVTQLADRFGRKNTVILSRLGLGNWVYFTVCICRKSSEHSSIHLVT